MFPDTANTNNHQQGNNRFEGSIFTGATKAPKISTKTAERRKLFCRPEKDSLGYTHSTLQIYLPVPFAVLQSGFVFLGTSTIS